MFYYSIPQAMATSSVNRSTESVHVMSSANFCHAVGTLGFVATVFGLALGAALLPEAVAAGGAYALLASVAGGANMVGAGSAIVAGIAQCL
jgi:hypothetical protein